jgi:hypothetical protein
MSGDADAECTALARRQAGTTTCYRHSNGVYAWPKMKENGLRFQAKEAKKISLETAKQLYGQKGQPSKSVDRWAEVFGVNNYGIVLLNETNGDSTEDDDVRKGQYPFLLLDVEGAEHMKSYVHLPPIDVAAKVIVALKEKVKENPAEHIIDWDSDVEKKKRQARERLAGLDWTPNCCTSYNQKEKRNKPCLPNPTLNGWQLVPEETLANMPWAIAQAQPPPTAKKSAKRKEPEVETLPGLKIVRTEALEDAGFAWLLSLPVDENCTVEQVDGVLKVVQHKKRKVEEPEDEVAEDVPAAEA